MAFQLNHLRTNYWVQLSLLFITYVMTAKFGLSLDAVSGFATLIWPPTGIAFAALYLFGSRLWPAITVASFIVNLWTGAHLPVAAGMALGNTLEAVLGVYLFGRYVGKRSDLNKVKDIISLIFFVSIVSTFVSATIGVSSLWLGQILSDEAVLKTWRAWWIGDAISILVIAPFFLIWNKKPRLISGSRRWLEGLILVTTLACLCLIIFGPWLQSDQQHFFWPNLIFVFLIWTTLRFGQHANILLIIAVTVISAWGTFLGYGPFHGATLSDGLILLQLFIATVAVTGLCFGALGREREDALSLRTDFVSIASHELNTPITCLKLQMEVLKHGFDLSPLGANEVKLKQVINTSTRQLDRLTNLTEALLDISKIDSGTLSTEKENFDLSVLVAEVADNFCDYLMLANCEVEPSVTGNWNRYRIEQLLVNLLVNAMKYGPSKPVKVTLTKTSNQAILMVQDFGIGIAAENHERIFERFERIHTQSNITGMGLGLYISKQIVQSHQGNLTVESSLGHGSTFRVELPL